MRLAFLAASSYDTCRRLPELSAAEATLDILGQRLSESDAGFVVHAFRAERRLAEAVEQVIAEVSEPVEELLFYFSGYVVAADERGPALLLDGERLGAFSLKRLRRLLAEKARRSFVILDTITGFDEPATPHETVALLAAALVAPGETLELLAANRPSTPNAGRSPFANLFELVLDWQSVKSEPLTAHGLYAAMRAEEALFAELEAAELFPATASFELLIPVGGARSLPPSLPPEAGAELDLPGATALDAEARRQELEAAATSEASGDHAAALAHLFAAIRSQPREPEPYRTALSVFEKSGQPDAAWNAACALEALGAADVNESLLAAAHRPEGLLPAQGVLTDDDWRAHLFHVERDAPLDALLGALDGGAQAVGFETARRKRRLPALETGTEHDLEKSTTTLARTLLWSARVLGFPPPKLHVLEQVTGELAVAPLPEPTLLASKALGSGLGLPELAFLWARTLVLLRPEYRIASLFSAPGELEALGRAALSLAPAEGSSKPLDGDAKLFARGLKRHLRGPALAAVTSAAAGLTRAELPARLAAWRRMVEHTSARAGLLACGNLELALKLTERFPLPGGSAAEQTGDLLAFAVSPAYGTLRERLGVLVREP